MGPDWGGADFSGGWEVWNNGGMGSDMRGG